MGAITTTAIATWCGVKIDVHQHEPEIGWLSPIPSPVLLLRYDAFGSTRVYWLVDEDYSELLWLEEQSQEREPPDDKTRLYLAQRHAAVAQRQGDRARVDPDLAPAWGRMRHIEKLIATMGEDSPIEDARGWPFRAMWYELDIGASADDMSRITAADYTHPIGGIGLVPNNHGAFRIRAIPLRIL